MIAELPPQLSVDIDLVLDPKRTGHRERSEASRSGCKIGVEDALKLQQRLVVEAHVLHIVNVDAGALEAEGDSIRRKTGIALPARETLLLRRRYDGAVTQQAGSTIVIEGRDTQDKLIAHCRRPGVMAISR